MKAITVSMKWIALLLLGMGALFISIGVVVNFLDIPFESVSEERVFRYVFLGTFGGIGIILAIVGGIIGYRIQKKERQKEQLIRDGNYVWAEIVDVSPNYGVTFNGRSPFVLRCKLQHTDGQTYILKSRYLRFNPESLLADGKVKVWFDAYDIKRYYVDVDGSIKNGYIEI